MKPTKSPTRPLYKLGAVQKARYVRGLAARLILTSNSDLWSLVHLLVRFVHVDGSTSTSTFPL